MQRTTFSRVARSLLFTTAVAASFAASRDARAVVHPFPGTLPGVQHFPGDTAPQCGVTTYCGGPVLSNVQIVPVYWTSGVSSVITQWAPTYLKTIANSELMDMLSQYSTAGRLGEACGQMTDAGLQYFGPATAFSTYQTITRGTAEAGVTITPTTTTGTNIADDNAAIGAELVAQIQAKNLPAPTYDKQGYPNTIYFVFFPSSYNITLQSMGSCQAFGGYHYSVTYTGEPSCKGQYIPYAVIPDCGTNQGSDLEGVVSHELAEAVTDTDVGPTTPTTGNYGDGAWYLGPTYPCTDPSNCPSNCGEVGDVCQMSGGGNIPGTSINSQNIWSQAQKSCVTSDPSLGTKPAPSGPPVSTCMAAPSPPDAGTGAKDAGSEGGVDAGSGSVEDASTGPTFDASPDSDGGGNLDNGGTSKSGCSCTMVPANASGGAGALGALLALALLGRSKSRSRR
jgi:hypothetical protein